MPKIVATLKRVEFWEIFAERFDPDGDRPAWSAGDDANGGTLAAGVGNTLAVAFTTTASLKEATVRTKVVGIFAVLTDDMPIESSEAWLGKYMQTPKGQRFASQLFSEAQTALMPYIREAVSSAAGRLGGGLAALAPGSSNRPRVEMELDEPAVYEPQTARLIAQAEKTKLRAVREGRHDLAQRAESIINDIKAKDAALAKASQRRDEAEKQLRRARERLLRATNTSRSLPARDTE